MSACGKSPSVISHNLKPKQVEAKVLHRMASWQVTTVRFDETYQQGHRTKHLTVNLTTRLSPSAYLLQSSSGGGAKTTWVSDSQEAVQYRSGATHYVIASNPPGGFEQRRLLGTGLASMITASRLRSASVKGNVAVLNMQTPIASGKSVHAELWFNLVSNKPVKWVSSWGSGNVTEVVRDFVVNPSLSSGTFHFVPPSGVTAEVVSSSVGAEQTLAFPVVMPPPQSHLILNHVTVNGTYHHEVLLDFSDGNSSPILVTESSSTSFSPPSGVNLSSQTVGTLTIRRGSLPLGGEMAVFKVGKTMVVVEGQASQVDNLLSAWGNALNVLPSASITNNSAPSSP